MDNEQVADLLHEIAALLELKGENPFKSRAYTNAARAIESSTESIADLVNENRLKQLGGIGEALQTKITTYVSTGSLPYHEELKSSLPPGLLEMLEIPGLGPKKVKLIYDSLGLETIDALEASCKDGSVAALKGMGKKSAENILSGIEQIRSFQTQHRYSTAIKIAEELLDDLRAHPAVTRVSLAGSIRRCKEVVKDLDLIASSQTPKPIMDFFCSRPGVLRVLAHGETKSAVLLEGGIQCDLRVVDDSQYTYALHHFTGSKEHNVALRQRAISMGMKMSEWGLFKKDGDSETLIPCRDESDLFHHLGLDFIPPELRENLGEIEEAENHNLPRLIEWTDIRGTFHNHTNETDGKNTLEEMAGAAASIGLEYFGIADHSQSSFQVRGLNEERLLKQIEQIRAYNKTKPDCILLAGSEVDILKGGKLDFPNDLMAQLDYVVASAHQFVNDEKEMTARLVKAAENPHVTMLGHITGRLLLKRNPYPVNIPKVIDACAANGTWIELNSNPYRLDMDWRWWKLARDQGVKCAINPDAHHTAQIGFIKLGAQIARKGWLRKEDVVNTLPLREILPLLKK